jgi:hypothetical protein
MPASPRSLCPWQVLSILSTFLSLATGIEASEQARVDRPHPYDPRTSEGQTHLLAVLRAGLPPGFSITQASPGSTPDDWWTDDPKSGLLVEGTRPGGTVRFWCLPEQWIGIRKVANQSPGDLYWRGIFRLGDCLVIAHDFSVLPPSLGGSTCSLVNNGFDDAMERFGAVLQPIDDDASRLIAAHCSTLAEREEAATSLIECGIPAPATFRRVAAESSGEPLQMLAGALGLLGDEASLDLLRRQVADPKIADGDRGFVASALGYHHDPRMGPALLQALGLATSTNAISRIVKVLDPQRFQPAKPLLLALFSRLQEKGDVAQTLATLGAQDLVPSLRAYVESKQQIGLHDEAAELALLRLSGDWGHPDACFRLHFVPLERAVLGQPMPSTVLVENLSDHAQPTPRIPGDILVDGHRVPQHVEFAEGKHYVHLTPGEIDTSTFDVGTLFTQPGAHTLQVTLGTATSNLVHVIITTLSLHP